MNRAEEFEEVRSPLFFLAYRLLSSVAEAEDVVQEAWLRYEAVPARPRSPKAFLSAVVTRISIDLLRSARARREGYVGDWLPEPLLTDPYEDPARSAEQGESVSMAALLLLERLSPLEHDDRRAGQRAETSRAAGWGPVLLGRKSRGPGHRGRPRRTAAVRGVTVDGARDRAVTRRARQGDVVAGDVAADDAPVAARLLVERGGRIAL